MDHNEIIDDLITSGATEFGRDEIKCADKEVCVRQVIVTTNSTRGQGVPGDPIRRVRQIWSMDGDLLAEKELW